MKKEEAVYKMVVEHLHVTHASYSHYEGFSGRLFKDGEFYHCNSYSAIVDEEKLDLSHMADEGWEILDVVKKKQLTINVSGPAGSGKSIVALMIAEMLEDSDFEYLNVDASGDIDDMEQFDMEYLTQRTSPKTKIKIVTTQTPREKT